MDKYIKKVMQKLTGFSLKHKNLELDTSLKIEHGSIWISSNKCKGCVVGWDSDSNYLVIIRTPKIQSDVKEFEQEVEKQMAYLAIESRKLTNKEGE